MGLSGDEGRHVQAMEQALAAIHETIQGRSPATFIIASDGRSVSLSCRVSPELAQLVAAQLGAHYPDCTISLSHDDPYQSSIWFADLHLCPDVFPIRRYVQFEDTLIQNKVGQFLSQPILRAIVGQHRTSLDLRRVMDEGRILIVNLSKGRIGEDGSTLLGSLLVTGIQLAAMSRADIPEQDRRDFFLYVDEFQNFAAESFATILSEARKYRHTSRLAIRRAGPSGRAGPARHRFPGGIPCRLRGGRQDYQARGHSRNRVPSERNDQ